MKVTLKIHPHNEEELKQVAALLTALKFTDKKSVEPAVKADKITQPKTEPVKTGQPVKAEEVKVEEPKQPVDTKGITLDKLLEAVQHKIQMGHREAIKTQLNKFGAKNVSALAAEHYVEFSDFINKL